jgi:hypothetical protein
MSSSIRMKSNRSKWTTLRYGFASFDGSIKQILKVKFAKDPNEEIIEFFAFQQDNKLYHTSVHSEKGIEKPSRVHNQLNNPERWCNRDRAKFPEILQSPLPIWKSLNAPWGIIFVPVHWGADRAGKNLYKTMKSKEQVDNQSRILDLSDCEESEEFIGNLCLYFIPAKLSSRSKFKDWTSNRRNEKHLIDIYEDSIPWIGSSMELKKGRGLFSRSGQVAGGDPTR